MGDWHLTLGAGVYAPPQSEVDGLSARLNLPRNAKERGGGFGRPFSMRTFFSMRTLFGITRCSIHRKNAWDVATLCSEER
jgi:hypothetical protein